MRRTVGMVIAVGLIASCGSKSGLDESTTLHSTGGAGHDANATGGASGSISALAGQAGSAGAGTAIPDAAAEGASTGSDSGAADAVTETNGSDVSPVCVPLPYTEAPTDVRLMPGCPMDPNLPECKTADVGVLVDRTGEPQSVACLNASGRAHGCSPFMQVRTAMNVFVKFDVCSEKLTFDKVSDCGAGPVIEYTVFSRCLQCDATITGYRLLVLDKDLRPVVAIRHDMRMGRCVP